MHESGNLVFVAAVSGDLCTSVESELIWQGRQCLTYNNQGKLTEPSQRMKLTHSGTPPRIREFDAGAIMRRHDASQISHTYFYVLRACAYAIE